ncbi:MAG: helix-turn-helix domain-containing protein [Planctomycetaceae bacterium]
MRGRLPRPLSIASDDRVALQQVARSESLPWYQVRRARIVLANARGVRTSTIAFQMQCDESTVWRTCRRYEQSGLAGLLAPPRRSGHPDRISPPPAGPDRRTRLLGTGRQRAAHHPLVQ